MDVKEWMREALHQRPELGKRIADTMGFSSVAVLMDFLEDSKQSFPAFSQLLQVIEEISPETYTQVVGEYLEGLEDTHPFVLLGLEFASVHRLFSLTDKLINKLVRTSSITNKEWAYFYQLDVNIKRGSFDPSEVPNQLLRIQTYSFEMNVFSKFLLIYIYFPKYLYSTIYEFAQHTEELINNIDDPFLHQSYKLRYSIIMTFCTLHRHRIEESRTFALYVLHHSSSSNMKGMILHHLGHSYLFESYEESVHYLQEAREVFDKIGSERKVDVERSITFLQNYWGVEPEFIKPDSQHLVDRQGMIHHYIDKDKQKAEALLNNMNEAELNDYHKAFHYYYKGLLSANKKDFYLSITYFKKIGEGFFREISIQELEKRGEDPLALAALRL